MGDKLGHLKPVSLWNHFEEICKRPRPSRKEELVAEYVVSVAKKNKLKYERDSFGNVVIRKPATPGKENLKAVVLQGHLDMVAEKNSDVPHNFDKDPIQPYAEGDWVKAKGTTLGSDNGIGVAAALAVLEATDIEHGPLEALFTLDEETGLFGAQALKPGFVNADILLNMDSEEDGALYIGCAGGQSTIAKFSFNPSDAAANTIAKEIKITGLLGGHSGLNIQDGRGNAIKIMARLLYKLSNDFGIRLVTINGGSKHNAIPRECFTVISVPKNKAEEVNAFIGNYNQTVKSELASVEKNLQVVIVDSKSKAKLMDKNTSTNLINALYGVPHGVIKMSADIAGLVETSTNLAVIETKGKSVVITTSQRSSVESEKTDISAQVGLVFKMAKADVKHSDGYPGWKPDIHSPVLTVMKNVYKSAYKKFPEIKAIHAGLECGIIKEKYPDMDMISFGPTIQGAHSPDEKVQISTVERFWDLLLATLKNIPVKE
jgi:dipeptidase D